MYTIICDFVILLPSLKPHLTYNIHTLPINRPQTSIRRATAAQARPDKHQRMEEGELWKNVEENKQ